MKEKIQPKLKGQEKSELELLAEEAIGFFEEIGVVRCAWSPTSGCNNATKSRLPNRPSLTEDEKQGVDQ